MFAYNAVSKGLKRNLRLELLESRQLLAASALSQVGSGSVIDAGHDSDELVFAEFVGSSASDPPPLSHHHAAPGGGKTDPPSGSPGGLSASLNNGVLTIHGSTGADTVLVRQSSAKISVSGVSGSWASNKVKSIVINLNDGNDHVSLDSLANGGSQVLKTKITIHSGGGDETVRLADGHDVAFSGAGHALVVAADGSVTLDGQPVTWDPPAPDPDPEPDPPSSGWFSTYLKDEALRTLGSSYYVDGLIDRVEIIAMLLSAQDNGAVDADELADLQLVAGNQTLFGSAEHVWKLTSYLVMGNAANAKYLGQTLGNLYVGATDAHLGNLVNKWFLGLDRPTTSYAYVQAAGTLFVNGASYSDIDQGALNNCAFMAALAETALRTPDVINNMFIVNGDGTYTVRFFRSGVAEYVTVDSYLPVNSYGNFVYALGGKSASNAGNELWVALAEKGFAQVGALTGFNRQNSYSSIEFLYAYTTLSQISGQSTVGIAYTSTSSSFTTLANAYNSGELICLISYASPPTSGIVSNHAYAVVGFDAVAGTVTLFNPWGSSYGLVTLSWSQVQANFSYFDRTV
jgi:hypothetical protein